MLKQVCIIPLYAQVVTFNVIVVAVGYKAVLAQGEAVQRDDLSRLQNMNQTLQNTKQVCLYGAIKLCSC